MDCTNHRQWSLGSPLWYSYHNFFMRSASLADWYHLFPRGKSGHGTEAFVTFCLEQNLAPKLLIIFIEPNPKLAIPSIHLPRLQLNRHRLIRLTGNDDILIRRIRLLNLLLVRAHEPHARNNPRRNIREHELEQQAILTGRRVADLGDSVSRAANLDDVLLDLNSSQQSLLIAIVPLALPLLFCSTAREVCLMLSALRMREVGSVVLVDCQTELALEASDVVLEEVWVFVEVDGLERELSKTLSSIGIGCG
jgi:hypothetical protein